MAAVNNTLNIHKIYQLKENGKFKEMLLEIELLDVSNEEEEIILSKIKAETLMELGKLNEASEIILKLTQKKVDNILQQVEIQLLNADLFVRLGKLNEVLVILNNIQTQLSQPHNINQDIFNKINGQMFNLMGYIQLSNGNLEKGIESCTKSIKYFNDSDNIHLTANPINNLGSIHFILGNLDKSLEFYQEAYKIRNQAGNKKILAGSLNNIALVYRKKGELNTSLDYHHRSLQIREEIGNSQEITHSLNNIGIIYGNKGEFDQALTYHNRALKIRREIGNIHHISQSLNNMGAVYFDKGDHDKAIELFEEALMLKNKIKIDFKTSYTLFNLIELYVFIENHDKANEYFSQIKEISLSTKDKTTTFLTRLAEALILKSSKRQRNITNAEQILSILVEEEIVDYNFTLRAMMHLVDILLVELKLYGQSIVLEDINDIIDKMKNIANGENLWLTKVQTSIIEFKLKLLSGDTSGAEEVLDDAISLSLEKNLNRIHKILKLHKIDLNQKRDLWKALNDLNLPLSKKINYSIIINHTETTQQSIFKSLYHNDVENLDEDTIFAALSHPLRRKILERMHHKGFITYSIIKNDMEILPGSIYNHLKSLNQFIIQNEDQSYSLNVNGEALCNWIFGEKTKNVKIMRTEFNDF